ncbi:MAG: FAD/NAD(P)-binding protein [Saprospiraceae bacterium]|nr:FAD/NAD(P)-binding protein [Saprospiraceae bacterium]
MTAVQLIEKSTTSFEIILINDIATLNKGIAFNPYSDKHLLNVPAVRMSAYPTHPEHFLEWVMQLDQFKKLDQMLIANSFLPRQLYGEYLSQIWEKAKTLAGSKQITLRLIESIVVDLDISNDSVQVLLDNKLKLGVDYCVIATGNQLPRNPKIPNMDFYKSINYFQNPWKIESVKNVKENEPVLIIGNGLSMVDSVFGLIEQGFRGEIYSISPNGFNILAHRNNAFTYLKLAEELNDDLTLYELVKLINKHLKSAKELGISAEPIIDSLRPFTQKIWKSFSDQEKALFMSRLRHIWVTARHRIPLESHDRILQLENDGRLHMFAGKIINITETQEFITIEYFDKNENIQKKLKVSRVINCTGPETDILNLEKSLLKNCLLKGILKQDKLKLGISTDTESFQVRKSDGKPHSNLFTLGSNLKGELWESTAVFEISVQAEKLAEKLVGQL